MDVLLDTPHLVLETSRTFSDTAEAPEALFIAQALRLRAVYKSIKVHLGQGQDLIVSIQIYFMYKYTYKNAGFCILCIDEFKILKFSNRLSKFSMIFTEKRHRRQPSPPAPQRPYDVSRGQNRYVTLPLQKTTISKLGLILLSSFLASIWFIFFLFQYLDALLIDLRNYIPIFVRFILYYSYFNNFVG